MKGLGELVEELRASARAGRRLLLGLDFDGTLAPLTGHPDTARLPARTRRLLARLSRKRALRAAVVSGRSLAGVRDKVGLGGLDYAGNHGLEIRDGRGLWVHPEARRDRPAVQAVARALAPELARFRGAHLENKVWTLSLHAKELAPGVSARALRLLLGRIVAPHRGLRIQAGRKVWEVRPRLDWDKGRALLRLARGFAGAALLFAGDDSTDEEGFKTLGERALSVRVGPARRTNAGFILESQEQVDELLAAVDVLWS